MAVDDTEVAMPEVEVAAMPEVEVAAAVDVQGAAGAVPASVATEVPASVAAVVPSLAGLQPGQAALAAYLQAIEESRDDEFILVRVVGACSLFALLLVRFVPRPRWRSSRQTT